MNMDPRILVPTDHTQPNSSLYGLSPAIRAFDRTIGHIARTEIPVLLVGESGTGKEDIALEIHYRSQRSKEAFSKFNCRQVPNQSVPAWLAQFSSSTIDRTNKGSFFFDEIDQLAPATQDELLKWLTDDDNAPSGKGSPRIISASSRSLEDEVRDGRFREELYYVINGITLLVPPLRHRPEDIRPLIDLFMKKYGAILSRPVPPLGSSTMNSLLRYTWPGNVGQLESIARKIVELGDGQSALQYFSDIFVPTSPTGQSKVAKPKSQSLKEAVQEASREVERDLILKALTRTHWHRKQAAQELQIDARTLREKIKELGLTRGPNDSSIEDRE